MGGWAGGPFFVFCVFVVWGDGGENEYVSVERRSFFFRASCSLSPSTTRLLKPKTETGRNETARAAPTPE